MISEIVLNNYRFLNENSSFSFIADRRTKKLLSNVVEIDGRPVLKSIGLYGGNNSGKTNIVEFFKMLKKVISGNENVLFNKKIFCDSNNINVSITFNNSKKPGWCKFEFSYNHEKKEFEKEKFTKITYYGTGKPLENVCFELDREASVLNIYGEDKSTLLDVIMGQKLFAYSVRVDSGELNSLLEIKESLQELCQSILVIDLYNIPMGNTLYAFKNNDEKKKEFITSFVKHADLSIDNLSFAHGLLIKNNGDKIHEKALSEFEQAPDALKLFTTYGKAKVPSLFFDSAGTKKIEAVAAYIYDALNEGKMLVIDELDNGLHFMLSRAIVALFNNIENKKGQLFFTAHDLLLIDCGSLLRKEQIYLLTRTKKGAQLCCFGDMTVAESGIRENTNLLNQYYKGAFGDVPSPSFVSDLLKIKGDIDA